MFVKDTHQSNKKDDKETNGAHRGAQRREKLYEDLRKRVADNDIIRNHGWMEKKKGNKVSWLSYL